MKSIFSGLIFICLAQLAFSAAPVFSREVILIENLATSGEGELLVKILIKKFKLPQELITLRNTNQNCEVRSEAIIHLCLLASGELEVRKMNQYVVKNSLGIFLNQSEGVEL